MKRVLYITPHLSTGGLPQYLLTKIKEFSNEVEAYVVEWDDITGGVFVVQRNQIKDIAKGFWTLSTEKDQIFNIINELKPDIVHFEEIAETFVENSILKDIWDEDREYLIVETTHGSTINSSVVRYLPDHFIFPSEYCKDNFSNLGVPMTVWDIPITPKERKLTKNEIKEKLGISTCGSCKHILNVGLFTPGKNQAEAFEIARQFEYHNVYFHFVGNQAMNFEEYWKPLMDDKPENVFVWGERSDVDLFYQMADGLLFTSKFELNPLVVKEALAWDLPVFMYNLHTYQGKYDNNPNIRFLDGDVEHSMGLIKNLFLGKKPNPVKPRDKSKEVAVVLTHADTETKKKLLKSCLQELKKQGYDTIVSTHIHDITEDIHDLIDYIVYDKDNPVIYKDEYQKYNSFLQYSLGDHRFFMKYIMLYNHGYAAIKLMKNAAGIADINKYEKIHFVNYDYIVTDPTVLDEHSKLLDTNDVISYQWGNNADTICTGFFSTHTKLFIKVLDGVNSKEDFCKLGKHICEDTVFELYKNNNAKIHQLRQEDLIKKIITNKVGVKVFPLYDINEDNKNSSMVVICPCIDENGNYYLCLNYNYDNASAIIGLKNSKLDFETEIGNRSIKIINVDKDLLEEGITLEINGIVHDRLNTKTAMGNMQVYNNSDFINLKDYVR